MIQFTLSAAFLHDSEIAFAGKKTVNDSSPHDSVKCDVLIFPSRQVVRP